MKTIPLTQNQFTLIDDADFERVSGFCWYALKTKGGFYAGTTINKNGKRAILYLHRFITNAPDGLLVDHLNHNGLDNQKQNLRVCTKIQNQRNRVRQKNAQSSQYKGICFCKTHKRWLVNIRVNGRKKFIGYFKNELDAARAYDKAAKIYHKEFAFLNFPD